MICSTTRFKATSKWDCCESYELQQREFINKATMLVLFELMRKIKAKLTQLCSLCTAKNRFWLNRSQETCQNEWPVFNLWWQRLKLHSKGYWYAHDQKKNCFYSYLTILFFILFFVSPMIFNKEKLSIRLQCLYFLN